MRGVGAKNGIPVRDLIDACPASGDPVQYWQGYELMAAFMDRKCRQEQWIK
jgi:hypothetical protein